MATIKITIKNETSAFTLDTLPSESIASVKAQYLESGKNVGHPNYILLLHKGKELPDEKSLAELGITDGDVLVHIEAAHEPFRPLNYKALAQAIKTRRRHEEANLKMMKEDNIWAAGQGKMTLYGTVHRLGLEKSLISTSNAKSPQFVPIQPTSGRAFFNQMSVRVNGCAFHVLPSMEGRWNGELATVPAQDEGNQVCSYDLIFRDDEGVWSQRQSRTTISGLTSTQHFWIKPVADGILKVETDDPSLRGSDITMQELGMNFLIITATSKRSGRPIMVETITGVDSSRRLRTIQRFDETGAFRSVYVMNETRVVDAVSGAMEKYENVF
uniref:Ubiquitin-like domain-containing protein n=1 Tax=Globisporangium ultimum (strain ATCC 200006 / CBS 805.95 / DAOM BR144) TaxID=431595 RepID=K3W9Y8_GLOUD